MFTATVLLVGAALLPASAHAPSPCTVPMVTRTAGAPAIEMLTIPAGATKEVPVGPSGGAVTLLLPLSPGIAADFVRGAEKATLVVSCSADQVLVTLRRPDGSERRLPPVERKGYKDWDLRVSLTMAGGAQRVFDVRVPHVREDVGGPALDIFQGKIPMEPDDVSVTMEVRERAAAAPVLAGSAPISRIGDFMTVEGKLGGRPAGRFIVDLAASRSVVSKRYLPAGVSPRPLTAVEHSAAGTRVLAQGPLGAGGEVTSALGIAEVGPLEVGDIRVDALNFMIVESIPRMDGEEIAGVLGLDLLGQATRVAFGYGGPGAAPILTLGGPPSIDHPDAVIPFTMAGNLVFLEGHVGGTPVSFVADTGSRLSFLAPEVARAAGLEPGSKTERVRGLDGNALPAPLASAPSLEVGGARFADQPFAIVDLPVLRSIGAGERSGLLGQPFWRQFSRIEIDFGQSTISLHR